MGTNQHNIKLAHHLLIASLKMRNPLLHIAHYISAQLRVCISETTKTSTSTNEQITTSIVDGKTVTTRVISTTKDGVTETKTLVEKQTTEEKPQESQEVCFRDAPF